VYPGYTSIIPGPGAYTEIFRGRGFEIFFYGRGNFPKRVGVMTQKPLPYYAPDQDCSQVRRGSGHPSRLKMYGENPDLL